MFREEEHHRAEPLTADEIFLHLYQSAGASKLETSEYTHRLKKVHTIRKTRNDKEDPKTFPQNVILCPLEIDFLPFLLQYPKV
jgi:hypothetical protein